jgi:hypothetical protein
MAAIALRSARRSRKARAVGASSRRPSSAASAPARALAAARPAASSAGMSASPRIPRPERLDGHGHRVRREVPGAGAGPGAGAALELGEPLRGQPAALEGAHGLPDGLDRRLLPAPAPGPHRAAVEHHRRLVDAGERHERGGDRLVAAHDADDGVEVVRVDHQLDGVRDDLARDERGPHARRALGLVVRDGDRVEREGDAAGLRDRRGDLVGQLPVADVARHRPRPRRRDPHDGAVEPVGVDPHGPEV